MALIMRKQTSSWRPGLLPEAMVFGVERGHLVFSKLVYFLLLFPRRTSPATSLGDCWHTGLPISKGSVPLLGFRRLEFVCMRADNGGLGLCNTGHFLISFYLFGKKPSRCTSSPKMRRVFIVILTTYHVTPFSAELYHQGGCIFVKC